MKKKSVEKTFHTAAVKYVCCCSSFSFRTSLLPGLWFVWETTSDKHLQETSAVGRRRAAEHMRPCRCYHSLVADLENIWQASGKSPFTPALWDGFTANPESPPVMEKVAHVSGVAPGAPLTSASHLNSVRALCGIWMVRRSADRLMRNSKKHAEQPGRAGVTSLYFPRGPVPFGSFTCCGSDSQTWVWEVTLIRVGRSRHSMHFLLYM